MLLWNSRSKFELSFSGRGTMGECAIPAISRELDDTMFIGRDVVKLHSATQFETTLRFLGIDSKPNVPSYGTPSFVQYSAGGKGASLPCERNVDWPLLDWSTRVSCDQ
jgi:hypothetical protein